MKCPSCERAAAPTLEGANGLVDQGKKPRGCADLEYAEHMRDEKLVNKLTKMDFPLDMDNIPECFLQKAEKELGETEEVRKSCLSQIRNLIKGKSTTWESLSDTDLLIFLRVRKFDVKKAFSIFECWSSLEKRFKEYGYNPCFDSVIKACQKDLFTVLPKRDFDGAIILVFKVRHYDVSEFKFEEIFVAAAIMTMACLTLYPVTQICGIKFIADVRGLKFNQITKARLRIFHFVFTVMSNSVPFRPKGAFFFNDSMFFPRIWQILKHLLPKKLRDRAHFYGADSNVLLNHLKNERIPKDFGGCADYNNELCMEILEKFRDTAICKQLLTSEI